MKIVSVFIMLVFFVIVSNKAYSQYSTNIPMQNIGNSIQGILAVPYSSTTQQGYMVGQSALINSQGSYLLNESNANINNQEAYSMQLKNSQLRTRTYFENRQINRYYRDIETWQYEERCRLKRSGQYTKEAIIDLYNIPKP